MKKVLEALEKHFPMQVLRYDATLGSNKVQKKIASALLSVWTLSVSLCVCVCVCVQMITASGGGEGKWIEKEGRESGRPCMHTHTIIVAETILPPCPMSDKDLALHDGDRCLELLFDSNLV